MESAEERNFSQSGRERDAAAGWPLGDYSNNAHIPSPEDTCFGEDFEIECFYLHIGICSSHNMDLSSTSKIRPTASNRRLRQSFVANVAEDDEEVVEEQHEAQEQTEVHEHAERSTSSEENISPRVTVSGLIKVRNVTACSLPYIQAGAAHDDVADPPSHYLPSSIHTSFPLPIIFNWFYSNLFIKYDFISHPPINPSFTFILPSNNQVHQEVGSIDQSQQPVEIVKSAVIKVIPQPTFLLPTCSSLYDLHNSCAQPATYPQLTQKQSAAKAPRPIGRLIVEELQLPNICEHLCAPH
ncbi:hypothetical protein CKAN_00460500 [Cinnamomum micranthum f. kanehirae]|uniref:Uncharacterized protein n=1 Tax=Cinnamomum micranthum f. kanehirae TaxID=337451 RepID=A0A3S3MWJ9_9MAGN|nr:hypothetical protein CKAN_00460500 [Cinnamomum micranthum f. kanehirae]